MPKVVNPIGKKYGLLTVESFAATTKCGHKTYTCKCDCGNTVVRTGTSIRRSKNSSCGCFSKKGVAHHQWTGVGEISGDFWYMHIVRSANGSKNGNKVRKPKELTLTIQKAWDLFLEQRRNCALSGVTLTFPKKGKDKSYTASLDRIDSSKGYVLGNVQWIHKDINIMKNKFDNEYFINVCREVCIFHAKEDTIKSNLPLHEQGRDILNEIESDSWLKL
jgi:hypothetical protein